MSKEQCMSSDRIQIVDDEHDFVRFLSKCLQRMDYVVTDVSTTGESAVAAARRSKPDLVLMDISLLGPMDGIEAATQIRSQLGIPIVFLTGSDDESTLQRAKISEPLGYLLKPFKPRELKTTIDTALYTFRATHERAKEAERLAGELGRTSVEDSVEGTFKARVSGGITSVNPSLARILGFESAEQVMKSGMTLHELLGIDREPARELILRLLRAGTIEGHELEAVRRNGRKVILLINMRIVSAQAGGEDCLEGTAIDVTTRKQLQALALQQERVFRDMIETLPHLFWTCRGDGICDFLSRRWVEYAGNPGIGQNESGWFTLLHTDDRDNFMAAWRASLESGKDLEADCRIRRVDGTWRWFSVHAVPFRDREGKVSKWFGSATDIDDQRRSLEGLLGSDHILNSVLNNIPHRVFWKNRELRFIGCNRHFAEDAGFQSPAEVVGKTDYDFFPAELAEKHVHEDHQVMQTGKVMKVVEEVSAPEGGKLYLQVIKAPIEDATHRITGVLVVCSVTSVQRLH